MMLENLIESLISLSDPARIEFAHRTYPTDLRVIGVTNPNLRRVLKELKATVKGQEPRAVIALAHALIEKEIFELQWLAYELLGSSKKILAALTPAAIDVLNVRLDNWVLTDTFCAKVLGPAWRTGLLGDDYFMQLQLSQDVWQRRLAIVATTALNIPANGGKGAARPTLLLCRGAVDDHDPMITKAVSWALRSLIRWDRPAVEKFLGKYKDRLARLVVREVTKKLETGRKNG